MGCSNARCVACPLPGSHHLWLPSPERASDLRLSLPGRRHNASCGWSCLPRLVDGEEATGLAKSSRPALGPGAVSPCLAALPEEGCLHGEAAGAGAFSSHPAFSATTFLRHLPGAAVKLRIACKILKRHSDEVVMSHASTVPPRLVVRAIRREHKWKRTHRINRDIATNPASSDLHLSEFRTLRCQPKAELLALWKAAHHE
jgi:hypothetical protein